jgi:hypothetical protein
VTERDNTRWEKTKRNQQRQKKQEKTKRDKKMPILRDKKQQKEARKDKKDKERGNRYKNRSDKSRCFNIFHFIWSQKRPNAEAWCLSFQAWRTNFNLIRFDGQEINDLGGQTFRAKKYRRSISHYFKCSILCS